MTRFHTVINFDCRFKIERFKFKIHSYTTNDSVVDQRSDDKKIITAENLLHILFTNSNLTGRNTKI
jgi:hypothetical protein